MLKLPSTVSTIDGISDKSSNKPKRDNKSQ